MTAEPGPSAEQRPAAEQGPAAGRPILRSERLFLRPVERDELESSVRWFADPEFADGFNMRAPLSLTAAQAWLDETAGTQGKSRWDFDVCLREDGRAVGMAGLFDVDAVNGSAELLVGIGERSLRDRRYGREAVGIVLDFAFAELRLHRVQLRVWAFNGRAIHVYERMGFRHEARHREGHFRHGRYHDILYMSLLAHEWASVDRTRMWELP